MSRFEEVVPEALAGERVDRVVSLISEISRKDAVDLIAAGGVTVDGNTPAKPSERLSAGSVIVMVVPTRDRSLTPDASVDVPIVFSDEHVVVVDKPAGLVVHPGSGQVDGTMIHGLLASIPELAEVGDDPDRPGIVHRLDKGTSGLLMVARTNEALDALSSQLADRSVVRRYVALVSGDVASEEGVVDAPIGRSPRDATRQAIVADGRHARTRYEVLERFKSASVTLLSCRLETGRTHQIRVHMEAIDHPVIGDERYGKGRPRQGLTRPFLHASELGFRHPTTGEMLTFESPVPDDLGQVLKELRADG